MKARNGLAALALGTALFAAPAFADTLQDAYNACVWKYSDEYQSADIMLQCSADEGRLVGCRVLDAPLQAHGLDKAALCVASHMSVATQTGEVRVPIRFKGI